MRARDKAGNPDRAATLAALAQTRHPESEPLQKLASELLDRHKPCRTRTGREPVQSFVTYTKKIEVNVPMDDSLFAPPGSNGR